MLQVSAVRLHACTKGVRSFGRQDVWATDVWATNFFPNIHLGDTKLDVWATRTRRLGDKSKSSNLGQPRMPGSCMWSLAVIICCSTHFSNLWNDSSVCTVYIVEHECTCCLYIFCSIHLALSTRYRCHLLLYCISQRCGVIVNNNFTLAFILRTFWSVLSYKIYRIAWFEAMMITFESR